MLYVLGLAAVAFLLEFLGPVILQKFFPQALMAPAPEVQERPKRAAAREAFVDEAMSEVTNPTNPLAKNAMVSPIAPTAAAMATANSASTDEALLLTGVDPEFDFDDFRTTGQNAGASMLAEQAAVVALSAQTQEVEVIQGIPDVFADDEAAHA